MDSGRVSSYDLLLQIHQTTQNPPALSIGLIIGNKTDFEGPADSETLPSLICDSCKTIVYGRHKLCQSDRPKNTCNRVALNFKVRNDAERNCSKKDCFI